MRFRELQHEDFEKLKNKGPFRDEVPDPRTSSVVVAEDNGEIVGFWCAFNAVHLEPLWIDPDHRQKAAVGRGLWRELKMLLGDNRVRSAFAMVADADAGLVLPMAYRLGFERMPASILFIGFDGEEEA